MRMFGFVQGFAMSGLFSICLAFSATAQGAPNTDVANANQTLKQTAESLYEAGELGRAVRLFQTACNQGSAESCYRAGQMYEAGEGITGVVESDVSKEWALSYFDSACQLGFADACPILQPYYDQHAAQCDAGTSAISCVYIGNARSYGWPYTGLQLEQAFVDYTKACDQGLGVGCSALGDLYFYGAGVKQSTAEGVANYELGCRRGHAEVCGIVGEFYRSGEQIPFDGGQAIAYFELGCDQQDLKSCKSLGYEFWRGELVAQDKVEAKRLLSPVCEAGDVGVCNDLALLD